MHEPWLNDISLQVRIEVHTAWKEPKKGAMAGSRAIAGQQGHAETATTAVGYLSAREQQLMHLSTARAQEVSAIDVDSRKCVLKSQ